MNDSDYNRHRIHILEMQLAQAEGALRACQRVKEAAEEAYGEVKEELLRIVEHLLGYEWNNLLTEDPHARKRPHREIGDWIIAKIKARMNRLRWAADPNVAERMKSVAKENKRLEAQLEEEEEALATLQAKHERMIEQIQAKDAELARLREDLTALRERAAILREKKQRGSASPSIDGEIPPWLDEWQESDHFLTDREALRAMGIRGLSLRTDVAQAVGFKDSASGAARRLFERLDDHGIIEQERPKAEMWGRPPYLLRLTERGREAFRLLFEDEPVESEYDRLIARHKSPEHVLLNMAARDALLEAGADAVDMYPRPVTLPSGGRMDVDLVAVFDDEPLYIEAERARSKKARKAKWSNLASVTRDFYVVVPNKKVKSAVISEVTGWTYDCPDDAAGGVVLHVCCLSTFDGEELWEYKRALTDKR